MYKIVNKFKHFQEFLWFKKNSSETRNKNKHSQPEIDNLPFLTLKDKLKHSLKSIPGCSDGEEFSCNAGNPGSIPGSEISPGEGNGNLLQYSCLENSMDRGAWWAIVHGVAKSWTRLRD